MRLNLNDDSFCPSISVLTERRKARWSAVSDLVNAIPIWWADDDGSGLIQGRLQVPVLGIYKGVWGCFASGEV
jgi:hypothetical protein